MGIYLPNMEMPKTGCYILSVDNTGKDKTIFTVAKQTHSGKIIPLHVGEAANIPPHGRLIDADALLEHMKKIHDKWKTEGHYTPTTDDEIMTMYAPTIISAEPCKERGE